MERELLKKFVLAIHPLTPEEAEAFISPWHPLSAKRKTVLTAAGDIERYLYFVLEGVQRSFYLGDDEREATMVFTYPPSFSGVADSFLTQTASLYFLETLSSSKFLRISNDELRRVMQAYPNVQEMVMKATALALRGILYRQVELQCFSSEEKFRALFRRSPHILHLVPHKYLASYLGMDPTNFSKLLGTIRI